MSNVGRIKVEVSFERSFSYHNKIGSGLQDRKDFLLG